MAQVASLFGSDKETTEAMDALLESEFSDVDVRLFPEADDDADSAEAAPVLAPSTVKAVAVPESVDPGVLTGMSEEETTFFVQGVKDGGTLLVAEVDEDRVEPLEQFLHEHGGRTYKEA